VAAGLCAVAVGGVPKIVMAPMAKMVLDRRPGEAIYRRSAGGYDRLARSPRSEKEMRELGKAASWGRGWHTAAMSDVPPPNPRANDVWIDDHGELRYFNGNEWVWYPDVPDSDLQPDVVIKGEED
jgi:hypothetical protein